MEIQGKGLPDKWLPVDTTPASEEPIEPPKANGARLPPTPPVASYEGSEDQIQLGQQLASIFKNANVHPVLIFGSKGSGKTSLLASLFRYIKLEEAHATLDLHDALFPADDPRWQTHAALARQLYYGKVQDFIRRKAPPATLDHTPFFIPVTLTHTTTGEVTRFAFLEGKGEWYMPVDQEVPFRPFQGLLQGLLQNYNAQATVIYIAPYTTGVRARDGSVESPNNEDLHRSDLGLFGAVNEYVSLRRATFHRDYHLFLMTKWDVYCGSISDPSFLRPDSESFKAVLKARFPQSWARFQNLNFQGSTQNKMFSSYCSGVIDDLTVLPPAQADSALIDFYARKLWDLLYENHTGKPLYPDVRPRPPGILDRLIGLLRS